MFEKSLKDKFRRIFDLDKVTFSEPGDSNEQECIFVQVDQARSKVTDGREIARVTGRIRVFVNQDKMPYGYFTKKIAAGKYADTKDLFFFDIEENIGQFQNISERSIGFVYFYQNQFNPPAGEIESISFQGVSE